MINISAVSKRFGSCVAIDDVTISFPAGAVSCVLGLNGAGKSTLLRLVAGLESPDSGSVLISGRRLRDARDPARAVGAQFGAAAMDPRHSVLRHLRWLAALGGVGASRVDTVLAEVGLAALAKRSIASLPLGARQRLAIAGALLGDPAVLVLDEPVNGLDVPGIVWLRHLLRRWAFEGRTIVLASHQLAEVVLTADRVVIMGSGRVVADGPLAELVPAGADPREHLEAALTAMLPQGAVL